MEGQDKASAIEQWIDRILDASEGYRVAHSYTRGTPKAPPLPTGMRHRGKYLGHPHQIAQVYLEHLGHLWCQGEYPEHQWLWTKMKKTIKEQRVKGLKRDPITVEQARTAIFRLSKRTAVGVDQWSPCGMEGPIGLGTRGVGSPPQ